MRAVNLIPTDARKGGGAGAAGRSGGGVYVLLGGLAILVGLVAVWALAGNGLADKRANLAQLKQETATAQAQAQELASFNDYSKVRQDRVSTVRSLALSRFDWAKALDAVARTLPTDAWVTSMTGTAAPGVSVDGGGSAAGALRGGRQVPAIELVGCAKSQSRVARLVSRLKAVPGVDRVAIADSVKSDGDGSGGDCGKADYPKFNMVLFFGNAVPAPGPASPVPSGGAAPTPPPAAQGATAGKAPTTSPAPGSSSSSTPAGGSS